MVHIFKPMLFHRLIYHKLKNQTKLQGFKSGPQTQVVAVPRFFMSAIISVEFKGTIISIH